MLCIISLYLYICTYRYFLTDFGIFHSARTSKNILSEKLPLNLTGIGEVVHTFPFLGAPQSYSNAVHVILAPHFKLSSWWAEFSVELTVNFQMEQLLIGIQQLVQAECFGLWQSPSSTQNGISYKTAPGAPKSTFFGKGVVDFLGLLWHLRSCFLPVWTKTGIRNSCFSDASVSEFPFHLQFHFLHLTPTQTSQ